jgi:hypothetical protein
MLFPTVEKTADEIFCPVSKPKERMKSAKILPKRTHRLVMANPVMSDDESKITPTAKY